MTIPSQWRLSRRKTGGTETSFRDQLRAGKFALLILSCDVTTENSCRGDTFTPGVLDAIRDGYDLLFRDVLFTYAPNKLRGVRG